MISSKIKAPKALKAIISDCGKKAKRVAFTNGCFDILHYGHVKYLEDAGKKGDLLIVAVNSDKSVKRLKGPERPLCPLRDRMRVLAGLSSVDYIVSFDEDTPAEIIRYLKPDILIKGADYKIKDIAGGEIVKSYGGVVKKIKFLKGFSVTSLINKITRRYGR
jgi:D-beta-D-heptose 7-phosphate kinase/D-beta-D-heptose 1-phosphate adenosyltransferase